MSKLIAPAPPGSKLAVAGGVILEVDKDGMVEAKDPELAKQLKAAGFKEPKKRSSRSAESTAPKEPESQPVAERVEEPKEEPKEEQKEERKPKRR